MNEEIDQEEVEDLVFEDENIEDLVFEDGLLFEEEENTEENIIKEKIQKKI